MSNFTLKTTKNPSQQEEAEEVNYRICIMSVYLIILIIIGIPLWWNATRIYRATLPLSKMRDIDVNSNTNKTFGMPLSSEYDLLISFINPDPSNCKIMIRGEEIEENLRPYLDEISYIFDFFIKSQWLYILNLEISPTKYNNHYGLNKSHLPHIITLLDTKLLSHFSPRPTINLLLYFQPCNDRPLYIFDEENRRVPSNAFFSPTWGGVYIINPNEQGILQKIVSTFITQLQKLFNIKNILNVNELKLKITSEMINSSRRTLRSLAKLLSEIENIVISDNVAEKIIIAMESVDLAEKLLKTGDVNKSLELAKAAFKNSEDAFSDPSMLPSLYFPEEDKKSVYIPLFFPIMISIFSSLPILLTLIAKRQEMQ